MKVQAKCTIRAWDNNSCVFYTPGGGELPGGLYEIDSDSDLATMKNGKEYVFEFDRNQTRTDEGEVVEKDYSCKKCGLVCKTLAELGQHSNQKHRDVHEAAELGDDEPAVFVEKGNKKKGKTFTCKECREVLPNLYALRVHKKSHDAKETAPEVGNEPVAA